MAMSGKNSLWKGYGPVAKQATDLLIIREVPGSNLGLLVFHLHPADQYQDLLPQYSLTF